MMHLIQTKPTRFRAIRAIYIKWLLEKTEEDIENAKLQVRLYEHEAEKLRVELSLLGAL